jgi:hypothetical protein
MPMRVTLSQETLKDLRGLPCSTKDSNDRDITSMNKKSNKNPNKSLVVVHSREDAKKSLPIIEELKRGRDKVLVMGIDIPSWAELRSHNIQHVTPAKYFDKSRCSRIDAEAIYLAEHWYRNVNGKMIWDGISLGEMAEYDFAFLFIDALRSIDIANSVIDLEAPDEIWLPADSPMRAPNSVRYEALIKAIACVAEREGIRVSIYE